MKHRTPLRFVFLLVFALGACGDSAPEQENPPACEADNSCSPIECGEPGAEPCEEPACGEPGAEPCEEPACGEPGAAPCEEPACDEPGGVPCEEPACGEPGGEPCPVCPGPTCDCSFVPTPEGCSAESDLIELNKTTLLTAEGQTNDSFELRLKVEPTAEVTIWVETSNPGEAEAYPLKLLFCPSGFTELYSDCATIEEAEAVLGPQSEVHWSRTISIEVFGVEDHLEDGDAPFALNFTVLSADARFAQASLYVPGVNNNVTPTLDAGKYDGLQDDALLRALYQDLKDHRAYGYSGSNSARTLMFSAIDLYDGGVEGLYTGIVIQEPRDSQGASALGFNTEHTWPQSQFDSVEPVKSDLHHLFPSQEGANGDRSSFDFGMVASVSPTDPNSVLGLPAGGSTNVYQVRPERRGDVARAHFYLAARYRFDTSLSAALDDDADATNGSINEFEEAVLRQWHMEDPVDILERRRNHRIAAYQGTRNPFVDWPELVARVANF